MQTKEMVGVMGICGVFIIALITFSRFNIEIDFASWIIMLSIWVLTFMVGINYIFSKE